MHGFKVQWLKNGGNMNVMPGDLNGRIGMDIKHSLFLNNILLSDQALYTCKASNVHGEARNSTEIKAISKFYFFNYLDHLHP